ncbi:MAG: hypothetical protein CVV27_13105 [Candidatus Melainabacteria bacterium HGW-Melainabacteria-1]|nr:MAG: hypothetical protein CVV27_13105 [Candidatus Melainabacteria bacterium HGW-Melainabacteria-1]
MRFPFKLPAFSLLVLLTACQSQPPLPQPLSAMQAVPTRQSETPRFYDTAKDALRWVELEARNWDFAARLAKVEGSMVDESGRCFEWRYYFTAVGKQKALMINSRREKREVANTYFGGSLDLGWRVDSGDALKKAQEKGLKTFPVTSMELDNFLVWDIRSFDGFYRVEAR